MAEGIALIGLNGCGKTTLGRMLAERLGYFPMDAEAYHFPFPEAEDPFAVFRSREEVREMMLADARVHPGFVLSSVWPNWGPELTALVGRVVLLSAPAGVRAERLSKRNLDRFGERVLPGGSLYASQREFEAIAAQRDPGEVERQAAGLSCPVLRLDASVPLEESLERILTWLGEDGRP